MTTSSHPTERYLGKTLEELIILSGRSLDHDTGLGFGPKSREHYRQVFRGWIKSNFSEMQKCLCVKCKGALDQWLRSDRAKLIAAVYDFLSSAKLDNVPALASCSIFIVDHAINEFCLMDIERFLLAIGLGEK